jgi:hypothetical protein
MTATAAGDNRSGRTGFPAEELREVAGIGAAHVQRDSYQHFQIADGGGQGLTWRK